MKLPEIDYAGMPAAPDVSKPYQAFDAMSKSMAEGFTAFGQEVIKTQTQKAAVDLQRGLNDIQNEIEANKYVTTAYLRQKLGDRFESLPPAIRSQVTQRGLDAATGEITEMDRDDIPSWVVADALFDVQAERLLDAASQRITVGSGWEKAFKDNASLDVLARKRAVNERQIKAMEAFHIEEQTGNAIDLANAGDFTGAYQTVEMARFDPAYREKVLDHVEKIEQTYPLFELLRTGDVGGMAEAIGKLNDPKQFGKLTSAERTSFTDRMKAEIAQFQHTVKRAQEDAFKAASDASWKVILGKEVAGVQPTFADIGDPTKLHADDQKAMIEYVKKLQKGEPIQTDWGVFAGLSELAATDRDEFAKTNLLRYKAQLGDAEFKHLLAAQLGLKGGNPDAYDQFQSTDETVNQGLRTFGIDPSSKDTDTLAKIGYLKSQVQKELAAEQKRNQGKALSLEERDAAVNRVLGREIDVRKKWFGSSKEVPGFKAGIPAAFATSFQRAVQALDPQAMADPTRKVKTLERRYKDFTFYEPAIAVAWNVQAGRSVLPDDAVRAWYHLEANWSRLEGQLRQTGGWTDNEALRKKRLVALAVQELLSTNKRR